MFCSERRALHLSRLIFIRARELNRDSDIVAHRAVLIILSWLKLLSLPQDVMGSVRARISKVCTLGHERVLHSLKASIRVSGTIVAEHSFHCHTHESYSMLRSPLNMSTARPKSSGTITPLSSFKHSLARRLRRPIVRLWEGLQTNPSSNSDTTCDRNSS